jgi:hypothetical protein
MPFWCKLQIDVGPIQKSDIARKPKPFFDMAMIAASGPLQTMMLDVDKSPNDSPKV